MVARRFGKAMIPVAALMLSAPAWSARPIACRDLPEALMKTLETPQTHRADADGACTLSHVQIGASRYQSLTIDRLRIAGADLPAGTDKPLPASLRIEAQGIRFAPRVENSHTRYLMSVMQRPFDARLSYDWDKAGGHLQIHEIMVESPWIGHMSLALDADVPKGGGAAAPSPTDFGIRRISLVLDNRSIVEAMLMPALIGMIPQDEDPAVEVPKRQQSVEQAVRKLPAAFADEASKDALIRFTRDFPHPTGHFEETLRFDAPVRLEDIKAGKDWLRGAHLEARYDARPAGAAP